MASIYKRRSDGPSIVSWHDHTGRRREKSTRTTDKRTAERIAAKLVNDAALRREAIIDPTSDRLRAAEARPLIDHLDGIEDSTGRGRTKRAIVGFRHHLADKGNTTSTVSFVD